MNGLLLTLTSIAAIASVIGAIFAMWRWSYAVKAYDLQKKQLYLQTLMLAESREYWRMGKEKYVKKYSKIPTTVEGELKKILKTLKIHCK